MFKKLLSTALAASMLAAMAVVPAHAAKFSSANWAQYERGFKFQETSGEFGKYFGEYTDTSYDNDQLTGVRMVGLATTTVGGNRTPVQYYWNSGSFEDGVPDAAYAHFRVNLATYSDEYRTAFNDFEMRAISSTGGEADTFTFATWTKNGNLISTAYAKDYTNANAYVTKDWGVLNHQGRNGTNFNKNAHNSSSVLSASDYDKVDLIAEYNKQTGVTFYLFGNGKFMGSWYDSTITTKHFNGVSFRVPKNRKIRDHDCYIAVKFDSDRIGHREYYNTSDYYVTMEDVLQDAGLGGAIDDTMIYKTKAGDLEWYMPGDEPEVYTYESGYSERQRINSNVTYSGNTATISCTNAAGTYTTAAKMLAGLYPQNGLTGVSYESGHPRAKCVKLSFDQTVSNDAMYLRYDTYYTSSVWAIQMWKNEGYLAVQLNGGGSTVTCNGKGGKPTALITGTVHFDWILEPDETHNRVNQFVYVNGTYIGSGYFGDRYAVKLADIILKTKTAAGNVTIANWSMTVYNKYATLEAIDAAIKGRSITWKSDYELGYEIKNGNINVFVTARNADGVSPNANTKVITAIYDNDGRLIDAKRDDYTGTRTLANETVTNSFTYSSDIKTIKAFVWDFIDGNIVKQVNAFTMPIQ